MGASTPTQDEVMMTPVGRTSVGDETGSVKQVVTVEVSPFDMHDEHADTASEEYSVLKSTRKDAQDMQRMGKEQQFVRHFRLLSVASFVALATASWEIAPFVLTPALKNGGQPALLYSCLWCFICFAPIYASLAEMSSMAPIAGAQYHWVSEFAPEGIQRILSYITGWLSTMAWQAGNIQGCFLVGSLVQVMISIANPDYPAPAWHATLLVIGAVAIAFTGTVFGNRILSYWQNAVFVVHILAYFAFIIPIWVNAPKASNEQVWKTFSNQGGYPSMSLAIMVGQLTGISAQVGVDTAAHMSEDVRNAAKSVPKAMFAIYIVNFVLVFPSIITLCYHMPNLDDALADPTEYPAIYVLRQSMSPGWLIAMLAIMVLLLIAGNIAYLAAVTRDLFAFARDKGFPFSRWVAKVDHTHHVPKNACIVSSGIAIALSLIYLGSPVAFYAITSLNTVALLSCYMFSIGCCMWRRIVHPETMPLAQFSLGRLGVPINGAAVIFTIWSCFWCFWPTSSPVTAPDFNWASAIYVFTMIASLVYFIVSARKHYVGPVMDIKSRRRATG